MGCLNMATGGRSDQLLDRQGGARSNRLHTLLPTGRTFQTYVCRSHSNQAVSFVILRQGATWLRLGGLFQLTILVMHMCAGKRAATRPGPLWPWRIKAPLLFHFKGAESPMPRLIMLETWVSAM